ncbi:MAG: N-acetylmuramoyl-L-alanine amidase [Verrucomicrobiales bacterium]|nr:N-acetylmuramoyl-L-alanine amidase [Verrucomicrobiales bacterium]
MRRSLRNLTCCAIVLLTALGSGCRSTQPPGKRLVRSGDEIIVAGQLFHTGTRVVTWMDPGGYDAYRVDRRFAPIQEAGWEASKPTLPKDASPNRFGVRKESLSPGQLEQVRGGGWPLTLLQEVVDQFVIHFDMSGTSRRCFEVLHDKRCLSVHFMIDLDGTIYQTLDAKERAWHATTSNGRSVGVEIASPGAFPIDQADRLQRWYERSANGRTVLKLPTDPANSGLLNPAYVPSPARPDAVEGTIQGKTLRQYDFTEEQYKALSRLTATLCRVFPKLRCDYPRDQQGNLVREKLPDADLKDYQGLIGHYHIQTDKVDPGPAFNWERVIHEARKLNRGASSRDEAR